jgi:cytoskeleton protein RodZ
MALGSTLANARLRAGLSIEDVASATRVRGTLVRGIEAEDFRGCGGDVYARGHIRAIARLLGIASEPLIREFDENFAEEAVTVAQVFEADRTVIRERRGMNWSVAMATGVVAVVAITATSLINRGSDADVAAPLPTRTVEVSPTQPTTDQPGTDDPAPQETGIEANARGVLVQMSFSGSSWIRVSNGQRVVFEGIEGPGSTRTFQDDGPLSVVLGNAGAVRLVVNGDDLGTAGTAGQVVRATFSPR